MHGENPDYLSRQLITCLGNKRALLAPIHSAVAQVRQRLGGRTLRCLDLFSGSGVVSRLLKQHASCLIANDLEEYAAVISHCFLSNRSAVEMASVEEAVADLNRHVLEAPLPPGFIETLYAPADDHAILPEERVFYTRENGRRIDNYRRLIAGLPAAMQPFLLAPLLSAASIHANTAGVFKGFYKDRRTGIGRFGGSGRDALSRILAPITLEAPVLSNHECDWAVFRQDANALAGTLRDLDLAYLDPPYNQHPYGSNYFMLNLIARYEEPDAISRVSGIPADWQRSGYNVRSGALRLLTDLVQTLDARFLLISFNNEGFIPPAEMQAMLARFGTVEMLEIPYNAFRGSRSFRNRPLHVTEHLFLVER